MVIFRQLAGGKVATGPFRLAWGRAGGEGASTCRSGLM